MKIAFFTEGRYYGKVPADHPNMRTDLAWIHLLDADHFYMYDFSESVRYDLGIVIIPKNRVDIPMNKIKNCCIKVATMQEGPCNYWADYTMYDQIQYMQLVNQVDFILAHNETDVRYYIGLFNKPTYVMPTAMVESLFTPDKQYTDRSNAIIGGNMCAWYGGMVSLMIAKNYSTEVWAPSMGRKIPGEDKIENLHHIPYVTWTSWMSSLQTFKLGIHMMPTVAAGTFALNCAYLKIPCIGNIKVDTQRKCHPTLSVDIDDIETASKLAIKLKNNQDFYNMCSEQAGILYAENYSSKFFKPRMLEIFKKELSC